MATAVINFVRDVVTRAVLRVAAHLGIEGQLAINVALATAEIAPLVILSGISAAAAPSVPKADAGKFTVRQNIPPRRRGYGRDRIAGAIMFEEAVHNVLHRVIAVHDGPIDAWETFLAHDDQLTIVANVVQRLDNKAFPTGRFKWYTREGAATETAYAELVAEEPTLYASTDRGDGIASWYLRCEHGQIEDYPRQFPNGPPEPSAIARLSKVYDWRDPTQDRLDESTWKWSENCAVCTVHELWRFQGEDWDQRFAPVLDQLTYEANYCDDPVPLKAGGTVKRYTLGGFYDVVNRPADRLAVMLDSFNGWLSVRGDGAFILKAGRFEKPTVVFSDPHVVDYSFDVFRPDEEAVNTLIVSYEDPAFLYSEVETDADRDEEDILERGGERSQPLSLGWVHVNSQARRLAKQRRYQNKGATGTTTTDLYGLKGLGHRYIRLEISEVEFLNGLDVEILDVQIDIAALQVTFQWRQAFAEQDEWDAATEEGQGPQPGDRAPITNDSVSTTTQLLIQSSYPDPTNILTAADVGATATITVAAHTRRYADMDVAVNTGTVTGLSFATQYFVYYDDADREGGAVTYHATTTATDALNSVAHPARHFVGAITTPADGAGGTSGGGGLPPGWDGDFGTIT